ncbi:hypothetical protein Vic_00041 [Mycolicibacterium phage Vic9]
MSEIVFALDMSKPVGQRMSPELIAEIQAVAPSVVVNGSITEAKLKDKAVTTPKLNEGAVTSPKIATGGVETENLADAGVTTSKVANGAITADKAGTGVSKATDADGEPIENDFRFVTASQFAAIESPDPDITYMIGPD